MSTLLGTALERVGSSSEVGETFVAIVAVALDDSVQLFPKSGLTLS